MSIQKLDSVLVDQIAAGEVVERPASVVKELVENSIDAGAERIVVMLEEGGLRRIEVRDDGPGIPSDELELALTSHATSKVRSQKDLESVGTLGFRGEALASISSVSRMEIHSCRSGEEGASIKIRFGKRSPIQASACAPGTRLIVEDLFAELPARLKFMKRTSTELSHCRAWVERLALAHPGIGFRCDHNGKTIFEALAEDDLPSRCSSVYGKGVASAMVSLEGEAPGFKLEARIGPPESARRNASRVHIFLNGRWVRDARLLRAVREGVREFVPVGHYPSLLLFLVVPPERVDVNVHPQKTEVRFRDERLVFSMILKTFQRGLCDAPWATRQVGSIGVSSNSISSLSSEENWQRPLSKPASVVSDAPPELPVTPVESSVGNFLSVSRTFLVREVPGGMEIIDQHALHERVNLEELRKEIQNGQVVSQKLLVPSLVDVEKTELDLLLARKEVFSKLGVEIEAFGEATLAVNAVPARIARLVPEKLVMDLLEIAAEFRKATPDTLQEESLHRMACRGAVMAGDYLDQTALEDLLRRGANLPQDRTCAHGRPVRVFLSNEDLEKAFHRR
ncbi:MAG: DNA mismatch repair endonuclease MutL [Planctomycetota bacterium]|jgi:DNA mismatch repair protein MutL|nr:DNA mismatch repair endonuclease MutL [Planctomycetota bacterium]MDP6940490.1 DNA mismatch repair endonuclease MutL [Planctomycetota bacterium]